MDERRVVETVDKLLETIRYEIDELREKGEDTTSLEKQLDDFSKRSNSLVDWFMREDEHAIKLFLTELVNFSRAVHDQYLSAQEGGLEEAEEVSSIGYNELMEEKDKTMKQLSQTMDLISSDDALLKEELGETDNLQTESKEQVTSADQMDALKLLQEGLDESEGSDQETKIDVKDNVEPEKPGIMKTEIPGVDEQVKDITDLIKTEKDKIEVLRSKGVDTLDKELKLSQQETLLVSLKEALVDGRYEDAKQIKSKIDEIGRDMF